MEFDTQSESVVVDDPEKLLLPRVRGGVPFVATAGVMEAAEPSELLVCGRNVRVCAGAR